MKALELDKDLILKEGTRIVDRQRNTMVILFPVKIKYGIVTTEDLVNKETEIQLDITKENNPDLWTAIKDITIEDLMQFIIDNKDFVYLNTVETQTVENEAEFQYLKPFILTIFSLLKNFTTIEIIDI